MKQRKQKLFGSTHNAHCFVYSDYSVTEARLEMAIEHPRGKFLGYTTLAQIRLVESDLAPHGWVPHILPGEVDHDTYWFVRDDFRPFGLLEILQRDEQRDEQHGPERLAILFLRADGIAAYDALFARNRAISLPSPWFSRITGSAAITVASDEAASWSVSPDGAVFCPNGSLSRSTLVLGRVSFAYRALTAIRAECAGTSGTCFKHRTNLSQRSSDARYRCG